MIYVAEHLVEQYWWEIYIAGMFLMFRRLLAWAIAYEYPPHYEGEGEKMAVWFAVVCGPLLWPFVRIVRGGMHVYYSPFWPHIKNLLRFVFVGKHFKRIEPKQRVLERAKAERMQNIRALEKVVGIPSEDDGVADFPSDLTTGEDPGRISSEIKI